MSTQESKIIMAQNIKRYMALKGVTNQQLCEDLGFKYTTFMDWIKAVTYPRIGKIEAMAQYFGCEKSDLIEDPTDNCIAQLRQMINVYCTNHNLTIQDFLDSCDIPSRDSLGFMIRLNSGRLANNEITRKVLNRMGVDLQNFPLTFKDSQKFFFFFDENEDIANGITSFSQGLKDSDKLTLDGKPLAPEAKEAIISALDLGLQAARSKNKENG